MTSEYFDEIVNANGNIPAEEPTAAQNCHGGIAKYDEQFHLVDNKDFPLPGVRYRITASTGEIFDGITDSQGFTQRVSTDFPAKLKIEIFGQDDSETIVGNP